MRGRVRARARVRSGCACSASAAMSLRATLESASSGHGKNHEIVVLLMREGNWRMRVRYSSPRGDIARTMCTCRLTWVGLDLGIGVGVGSRVGVRVPLDLLDEHGVEVGLVDG